MRPLVWFLLAAAAPAAAQELRVYSEFQRPDPFGDIAVADRGAPPREILSPVLARNAWASFWLACHLPEGATATLHLQQNPEKILQPHLYRARFTNTDQGWIPDALEKVDLPYVIRPPEGAPPVAGQNTTVFLLDVWVPPDVQPGRMRFQADMWVPDRWLTYPMEFRIAEAAVPGTHSGAGPLPPVLARADAALVAVLRARLCGARETGHPEDALSARRLLRRNARQDLSLAEARQVLDPAWCGQQPAAVSSRSPEWWLPVRAALYRNAP